MLNLLVATELTPESMSLLSRAKDVKTTLVTPTLQALKPHLADAHALIVRDDLIVDDTILDQAPQLKLVAVVAPTVSNVDMPKATARGILVMSTPGASAIAAGEHALAMMLALSRKLVQAHNSLRDGYWLLDRHRQAGVQLFGKTVGIIGLGRVGTLVALRCLAFGMTVLAYDPYVQDEQVPDKRVQLLGLRDLLSRSDFVTLHVPATRETYQMVNADFLSKMKRGARLINNAHGSLIDEAALVEALKSGQLAGAALDVFKDVPPYNNPLIGMENVIHTPHIGDNTLEALQDVSIRVVEQVLDALHDVDYRNVVNLPLLPGMNYEAIRPYMRLAECIGSIQINLARHPVVRVAIETSGEELNGLIKPITVGILKGLLRPILGDSVSAVNAPLLATERGWQITQVKGLRAREYQNHVTCRITLEDGENITVTGTLLDKREPYIVQINNYRMNFVPEGFLLIMGSYDMPGVIGTVGSLLSRHNVNIASWHTGRVTQGGHTLTVLTLDEAIPQHVMDELLALEFVRHAHQMTI